MCTKDNKMYTKNLVGLKDNKILEKKVDITVICVYMDLNIYY